MATGNSTGGWARPSGWRANVITTNPSRPRATAVRPLHVHANFFMALLLSIDLPLSDDELLGCEEARIDRVVRCDKQPAFRSRRPQVRCGRTGIVGLNGPAS